MKTPTTINSRYAGNCGIAPDAMSILRSLARVFAYWRMREINDKDFDVQSFHRGGRTTAQIVFCTRKYFLSHEQARALGEEIRNEIRTFKNEVGL